MIPFGLKRSLRCNMLSRQRAQMLSPNPTLEAVLSLLGRSPADEEALAIPGASERLARMLQAAVAQGAIGMAADIAGYCLRPWGFKPTDVKAKTLCLYGARDPIAGSRHGARWQKNLPQAQLEMVPGAGHLLAIPMWHRALSHLAPRQGRYVSSTPSCACMAWARAASGSSSGAGGSCAIR